MKNVIITGATSMLGIATIKECIKNGAEVTALLRTGSSRKQFLPQSEMLNIIECDLSRLRDVVLPERHYDSLFHFGWCFTDKMMRDHPVLQSKNISYTLDAVELAHKYGCIKFIGAGSQAEYGFHDECITEKTNIDPKTCYGIAKYAAGNLAGKLCDSYHMICIWARIFSVYGIHDGENTMISYAINQYLNRKKAVFSEGMQRWNYLFEEDAGKYFYLLGKKAVKSCIVNVAGAETKKLKDYVQEIADVLGENFEYERETQSSKSMMSIDPDVTLLQDITQYTPGVSFKEGISRIVSCKKKN